MLSSPKLYPSAELKAFFMWIKNVRVCSANYFLCGMPENRENIIQISHLKWMPLEGEVFEWKMGL